MAKVAVTGATGFIGGGLIDRLIAEGHQVNAIARDEAKLISLKEKYSKINIFPCPVEDYYLLKKALTGCNTVYHLASLKDVSLSADHTLKTVQSNITGTINLLNLTTELKEIKNVLAISSDKAVKISSVYGATKFIMENLFKEYDLINGSSCKYRVLRIGNVLYSSSSVLPRWKNALLKGEDVRLTEPTATRFFWTLDEVVDLIFECMEKAPDASPYCPEMKSARMGDILEVMVSKYGNGKSKIIVTGLQPGENLHEFIIENKSSAEAEKWTKEDLYKIL